MAYRRMALLIVLLAADSGCDSAPEAPVLRDAPVYRSASEGFRFRVPEGWSQTANSVLPEGDLPRDIFLARYTVQSQDGGASLQVLARNDVAPSDLGEYAQQPAFGIADWTILEPLNELTIGGVEAERLVHSGQLQGKTMLKHMTCFHRRGRLYAFVGLHWKSDPTARQQIERAVDSVMWE